MKFDGIYQFNEKGVKKFNELFEDKFSKNIVLNPDFELLKDPEYVDFIAGSNIFDTNDCVDNISMVNVSLSTSNDVNIVDQYHGYSCNVIYVLSSLFGRCKCYY